MRLRRNRLVVRRHRLLQLVRREQEDQRGRQVRPEIPDLPDLERQVLLVLQDLLGRRVAVTLARQDRRD